MPTKPTKGSRKTTKKARTTTARTKLTTHVAIVLDRSGSMWLIREPTVSAFNEQIKSIQTNSKGFKRTTVSLVTFSYKPDAPAIWMKDADELKELNRDDYVPNGTTALFDAVGWTINEFKKLPDAEDKNTAFLVVVISDGQENSSTNFNSEKIAALVKECQDTKHWTFTYLGANQDLSQVSKQLGIPMANTQAFTASAAGVQTLSHTHSINNASYFSARGVGATQTSAFYSGSADVLDDDENATTGSAKKTTIKKSKK